MSLLHIDICVFFTCLLFRNFYNDFLVWKYLQYSCFSQFGSEHKVSYNFKGSFFYDFFLFKQNWVIDENMMSRRTVQVSTDSGQKSDKDLLIGGIFLLLVPTAHFLFLIFFKHFLTSLLGSIQVPSPLPLLDQTREDIKAE